MCEQVVVTCVLEKTLGVDLNITCAVLSLSLSSSELSWSVFL